MVWELSGVIRKDVFEKMISEQSPEVGESGCEGWGDPWESLQEDSTAHANVLG